LLNWSGGSFSNLPFQDWGQGVNYLKYDVVYTGINGNKLDNFYYCSGDHTSTETNSPTGSDSIWSQKFFFEPDIGTQNDVTIKADIINFNNSFKERLKTNDNIATFNMSYTYKNITDDQLKCMLHFLEIKGGYRRFEHQIPSLYDRPKVYYCPQWSHTWISYNSNDLTVELIEDPLGVIPTGT
jgi:phage-related protein